MSATKDKTEISNLPAVEVDWTVKPTKKEICEVLQMRLLEELQEEFEDLVKTRGEVFAAYNDIVTSRGKSAAKDTVDEFEAFAEQLIQVFEKHGHTDRSDKIKVDTAYLHWLAEPDATGVKKYEVSVKLAGAVLASKQIDFKLTKKQQQKRLDLHEQIKELDEEAERISGLISEAQHKDFAKKMLYRQIMHDQDSAETLTALVGLARKASGDKYIEAFKSDD